MHGALWASFHSGESISVSCGWANVGHAAPVTAFGIWPKCCELWCFALKFSSTGSHGSLLHFFNIPFQFLTNFSMSVNKRLIRGYNLFNSYFISLKNCPLNKQSFSYHTVWHNSFVDYKEFLSIHKVRVSLKECRLIAEQTLLSKTSDRYSLSSIGLDPAACHLSHLNGPRRDLSVASQLHTLLTLTQSNARSAFGGRSSGSH